jgi:K+/H+ antiporter YhaU regulatory subunit KhtT
MDTFFVQEGCYVAGRTLEQLDLGGKTGTTVVAVIRKGKAHTNPPGDFAVAVGDMVVVLGSHAELNNAMKILSEKCPLVE